ncbi:MAG: RiPP maturation radical SAM C-methyltransferase [Devosia sp.]
MNAPARQTSKQPGATTVCLVNMPVSGVERPSIALGLLQSILLRHGLATQVLYPNLWFLDYFGLETTQTLISVRPEDAVVDWIFGAAAFPDFAPAHDDYLEKLQSVAPQLATNGLTKESLLALREQAVAFTDWTARKIAARQPKIVGCTSMFQQHVASLAVLRRLREIAPDIVTLMGGANCESVMGRTTHAHYPWVDYVVSGEADQFITELMDKILAKGREIAVEDLPFGVFGPHHRREGYPTTTAGDGAPRAITEDIRDLPLPVYDDYFAELSGCLYAGLVSPGLPMEFSRGCWWGARSHCTFCGLNGGNMSYRAKRPEKVVEEMAEMVRRHGTRRIEAVDNIMDLAYFRAVLPDLAALEEPYILFFETKSNLKKAQVKALADAGVHWIQPGIESLHSKVLTLMRKGCTAAQNVLLLKWCRQYGVRASWSIISEFPGEEDAWYEEMAAFMPALFHLQAGVTVRLRYDRYSPYFTRPDSYGLSLKPAELYRYAYPLDEAAMADQVYFFQDDAPAPLPEERPGLRAVRRRILEWRRAWRDGPPPVLDMHDTPGGLVIEDSRPGGVGMTLQGAERALMFAADDGPPEARVIDHMEKAGFEAALALDVAEKLIEARLMVRLDGRLISLALTKPHRKIPAPSAFPGGHVAKGKGLVEQLIAAV